MFFIFKYIKKVIDTFYLQIYRSVIQKIQVLLDCKVGLYSKIRGRYLKSSERKYIGKEKTNRYLSL